MVPTGPGTKMIDVWVVYEFIKRLAQPWEETEAYKLGLIDKDGKKLRSAKTAEERRASTYFDRLVRNIKRIMEKFGLKSKTATFAAAVWLMREMDENDGRNCDDVEYIEENVLVAVYDTNKYLEENAPTNATGAAVVGTGDTGIHWAYNRRPVGLVRRGRPYKSMLDGLKYLRRKTYERKGKTNENREA